MGTLGLTEKNDQSAFNTEIPYSKYILKNIAKLS